MKNTRKFLSIILALTMIMSMTAFAEGSNSITVTAAKTGETYVIYKLFDLEVDNAENPQAYSYKVNSGWSAFFGEGGEGAQYITVENGYVKEIKDGKTGAAALAKAAAEWTNKPAALTSKACADGETTVVFTGLENGYYLITSTLGTVAMTETTPAKEAVTIEEKNPEDTIIKEVKEDSTGNYGDNNDAQVGDTVEFKSTATLLKNTRNVKIYDKMDAGLTYNAGSVEIADLTKGTEYTVVENTDDGYAFIITFTEDYLEGLTADTTLTITYTAILNENAIVKTEDAENGEGGTIAIVDQNNTTKITYGDKQSAEDATVTTTHKFAVLKYDAKDSAKNPLAGAEFQLKKADAVVKLIKLDDNNYRIAKDDEEGAVESFVTNADGNIVIWGVDNDTDYTLLETKAPAGYNLLADEVSVNVGAENAAVVEVPNNSGMELPSTGGMGTTLFYIVGSVLVIGSAILLITKKRMNNDEE